MKYTKEQLQAMSDFEVNKALARMIYGYPKDKDIAKRIHSRAIDFCNNPSDIMPLAFEHGITVKCVACPAGSGFAHYAESYEGDIFTGYGEPCRVASMCLILVLQERDK